MALIRLFPDPDDARHDAFFGLLRRSGRVFEASIHGTSMEPSLGDGTRVRIEPRAEYREGQVVACVTAGELFAHRIVHRTARAGGAVITQGDGTTLCDPPTRVADILGEVTAFERDGAWLPLPPVALGAARGLARVHLALVRACLAVHYGLARRIAGTALVAATLLRRARPASPRP